MVEEDVEEIVEDDPAVLRTWWHGLRRRQRTFVLLGAALPTLLVVAFSIHFAGAFNRREPVDACEQFVADASGEEIQLGSATVTQHRGLWTVTAGPETGDGWRCTMHRGDDWTVVEVTQLPD